MNIGVWCWNWKAYKEKLKKKIIKRVKDYSYNKRLEKLEFWLIGIMVLVFTNGPGDLGSITGQVIPKTKKMVLDATLLNPQHYMVQSKWSNPGEGVKPFHWPRCCSYWKRKPSGHPRLWSANLLILQERTIRGDWIETFKIINRICNNRRHFFFYLNWKFTVKIKSTNQLDFFDYGVIYFWNKLPNEIKNN